MKFDKLLEIVADEPVFETGLLLAGTVEPTDVRRQLSRWVAAGKVVQLRRGLYALSPPFRKRIPHPFLVANRMMRGSYVSCQSALAHHGLIPEYVQEVTSVTSGRPGRRETPLGRFSFRHLKPSFLSGYRRVSLYEEQEALVATPEKALLDLVHLTPGGDAPAYLRELRLDWEGLKVDRLERFPGSPKIRRAARRIAALTRDEVGSYETL